MYPALLKYSLNKIRKKLPAVYNGGMKIDIVVPVFNEQKTLAGVIKKLLKSQLFTNVICVNDGSSDDSLAILHSFGSEITVIHCAKNKGKGYALAKGIEAATSPIIAFADADLVGFQKKHMLAMVQPLVKRQAEVAISIFDDYSFKIFQETASLLSGQRAYYRKDLVPLVAKMKSKRFGVEVFLNESLKNKKTKVLLLKGLKQLQKHQKIDAPDVLLTEVFKEVSEVSKEVYVINSKKLEARVKKWAKTHRIKIPKLFREPFDS